jgi:hypothetical protein
MILDACVRTEEGLADDDFRGMSLPGGALHRRRGRTCRVCWCRDCQYLAAGSATVNVVFPTAAVTMTGPLRDYSSIADSGNRMHRQFCERCGTPVTSTSEARPHLTILRAGTLDEPELAKPSLTIWTDSAPSWACVNEALPRAPRQPPPAG